MNHVKRKMISIKKVFVLLVVLSLLVIMAMVFPDGGLMHGPGIFILWISHALSGLALIIMTYRQKIAGKVKTFLLVAGFSAAGFVVGVVLHNLFYALATLMEHITILNALLGFLEGAFFMLAVILCPLGLLAGIIGTFVLWKQIPAENAE